jgi:hypothetical protein
VYRRFFGNVDRYNGVCADWAPGIFALSATAKDVLKACVKNLNKQEMELESNVRDGVRLLLCKIASAISSPLHVLSADSTQSEQQKYRCDLAVTEQETWNWSNLRLLAECKNEHFYDPEEGRLQAQGKRACGQALRYCEEIFKAQAHTNTTYGVITNWKHWILYKAMRKSAQEVRESDLVRIAAGEPMEDIGHAGEAWGFRLLLGSRVYAIDQEADRDELLGALSYFMDTVVRAAAEVAARPPRWGDDFWNGAVSNSGAGFGQGRMFDVGARSFGLLRRLHASGLKEVWAVKPIYKRTTTSSPQGSLLTQLGDDSVLAMKMGFEHDQKHAENLGLQTMEREAALLTLLGGGHPNLPSLVTYERRDLFAFMVTRPLGVDLAMWVSHYGPMPLTDAVDTWNGLSEGITHAHAQGIAHRDICPRNVVLEERGKACLIDFGFASKVEDACYRLVEVLLLST